MNAEGGPPRRVRVTSPRTLAGRPRRVRVTSEIDAQTRIGELYMSALLRAQLRLAGRVILALMVLVGGIPLAYSRFPALAEVRVLGMPLAWALLGLGVYPVMLLLGWLYVRSAERNEKDFADMVERS
ncbi:MAG TPA: hypothetical protein VFR87_18475 [Nocardioidaceae bacterium]|nr:hypothetical protein [Nocardioidaceae bacterium]